jgi:signal transduction histidine kinase
MGQKEINIYIGILIFSLLLLVIVVSYIVSYVNQTKRLNKEKLDAEVRGSELARKKISSDLHDDLGPVLATIKIYVNSITANSAKDIGLVQKINTNLDACLHQVRAMANTLMPNTLDRKGLKKAVEEFCENMETVVNFDIHLAFDNNFVVTNKDDEVNIYRIVQEIVTNTINHANAKALEIIFEANEHSLLISTIDNGRGFEHNEYNYNGKGCGLSNIKNRVHLLNGKVSIDTRPNEGVKYNITIPNLK